MSKQDNLNPRYAWERSKAVLDEFIEGLNNVAMDVAWVKAQLIIEAQAEFHERLGNSEEDAMAMAWEDFDIASRGRGEPCVTGAVFQLWSRLPHRFDAKFRKALEAAFKAAREATHPAARRYAPRDYEAKVQTVEDGFDDPEAIPLIHIPQVAAIKNARDIKDAINKVADFTALTLVEGGKGQPPEAEDDIF